MGRWKGVNDGEPWEVEVEVDRFTDREPFVVSIHTRDADEEGAHETIAALSSPQARQMSAGLLVLANQCDAANERATSQGDER